MGTGGWRDAGVRGGAPRPPARLRAPPPPAGLRPLNRPRGKERASGDTGPGFDADLQLPLLRLRHGFLGHAELVEPPEGGQHHGSHLLRVPSPQAAGGAALGGFLAALLLDHLLRLLRSLRSLFGHGGAAAARLPPAAPVRGAVPPYGMAAGAARSGTAVRPPAAMHRLAAQRHPPPRRGGRRPRGSPVLARPPEREEGAAGVVRGAPGAAAVPKIAPGGRAGRAFPRGGLGRAPRSLPCEGLPRLGAARPPALRRQPGSSPHELGPRTGAKRLKPQVGALLPASRPPPHRAGVRCWR